MTLLRESTPKAKKAHNCMWCDTMIFKGDRYVRQSIIYQGDFWEFKCHSACLDQLHFAQSKIAYPEDESLDYLRDVFSDLVNDGDVPKDLIRCNSQI